VYDLVPLVIRLKSARCTLKEIDPATTTPESQVHVKNLVACIRLGEYATDDAIDIPTQPEDMAKEEACLTSSIIGLRGALMADKMLYALKHG